MVDNVTNADLARQLSKLEGLIEGMRELSKAHKEETHRRIDDKFNEVISHLDRHERDIKSVASVASEAKDKAIAAEVDVRNLKRTSIGLGAGAGGLANLGIELIKSLLR